MVPRKDTALETAPEPSAENAPTPPPDAGGSLVDGGPPLPLLPPRIAGGEKVRYRFPHRDPPSPPAPLEVDVARRERPPRPFGRGAHRVVVALAEACAPGRDLGFEVGPHAASFLAGYRPYLPPPFPALLPVALYLLGWLPLLVGPRRRPLWHLDHAARIAFLHRLEKGPAIFAAAVRGLVGLVKFGVYHHPKLHRAIGYDPQPFVDQKVKERRERFGAPEVW